MKMRYVLTIGLLCAACSAGGCAQQPCSSTHCHQQPCSLNLPQATDPMQGINAEERQINIEKKDEQAMREDA